MAEPPNYPPGTPIWTDVSTPDPEASRTFYGTLFGWEAPETPDPEFGGYSNFYLDGKRVAGLALTMSPDQVPSWSTYISTADADATTEAVSAAGGEVVFPPMTVGTLGRMAGFHDPAGAFFGVWQPGDHTGAEVFNTTGALSWNELDTTDMDGAKSFYGAAVGWDSETSAVTAVGDMQYTEWKLGGRSVAGGMEMGENFPPGVPPHWLPYFGVVDADAAASKAQELGGRLLMAPMDIEPGRFAVLADPHGAVFAVFAVK